jgi:hypothetical protein
MTLAICCLLMTPSFADEGAEKRGFEPKLTPITFKLTYKSDALKVENPAENLGDLTQQIKLDLQLKKKLLTVWVLPNQQLMLNQLAKGLASIHKTVKITNSIVIGKVTVALTDSPKRLKVLKLWRSLQSNKVVKSIARPDQLSGKNLEMTIISPGLTLTKLRLTVAKAIDWRKRTDPIADVTWRGPVTKKDGDRGSGGRKRKKKGSGGGE